MGAIFRIIPQEGKDGRKERRIRPDHFLCFRADNIRYFFKGRCQCWNCASSVEPERADSAEVPCEVTLLTSSKKPVPTKRWCFTAM